MDFWWFQIIGYDRESNFGGVNLQKSGAGYKVPSVRLDDFLDIPRLNLLKVDVEGMEYEVISGSKKLISKHKPFLYIENDGTEKAKDSIELVKSLDYKAYWHVSSLFNPDNFVGDPENIYPQIASVNMLCLHNSVEAKIEGSSEIVDLNHHPATK